MTATVPAKKYNTGQVQASTPVEAMKDLLRDGPPGPWPEGWPAWDNVRDAHVALMYEVMASDPQYPGGTFRGDGIVMGVTARPGVSAGKYLKHGYLPAAWVAVKELRRLGCSLPVIFAHRGAAEWDHTLTKLVAPLGVTMMDLCEEERSDPMRILGGWESKIYSIERAPFERVLYLDADNIPLRDPSYIFDWRHLRENGAVLWPDVAPHDREEWLSEVVWRNVDMPPIPDVTACESGQVLIDKSRWWKELKLCRWMNEHSDWFYKFLFGDKDTFVLSPMRWYWNDPENNRANYHMIQHAPGGPGASLVHYDVARRALFQHCTRNKCTLDGYPAPASVLCGDWSKRHLAELKGLWAGRLWQNDDPTPEEKDMIRSMTGKTFLYERVGLDGRELRLIDDHTIGAGKARCEAEWNVFIDAEGPMLVIGDIDGSPTCILRQDGSGGWSGRWLDHERCEVVFKEA